MEDFTKKEFQEINDSIHFLETENHKKAKQVLDTIELFYAMIEEKDQKIHKLQEEKEELDNYILDNDI